MRRSNYMLRMRELQTEVAERRLARLCAHMQTKGPSSAAGPASAAAPAKAVAAAPAAGAGDFKASQPEHKAASSQSTGAGPPGLSTLAQRGQELLAGGPPGYIIEMLARTYATVAASVTVRTDNCLFHHRPRQSVERAESERLHQFVYRGEQERAGFAAAAPGETIGLCAHPPRMYAVVT